MGLLGLALAGSISLTYAQGVSVLWAKNMGGGGADYGNAVAVDQQGNVYVTGYYNNTGDFNPGSGTLSLTSAGSQDVFITKLDAAGNLVWAKSMGGSGADQGYGIAVDQQGNVYTTGYFSGTADFDPGAGTANLVSSGGVDIFVSKLDANGNYVWAKGMGGSGWDQGAAIALDMAGNVYTTGYFQYTADFDPGPGVFNPTAFGGFDIFVSKLDQAGQFVWAKSMGSTGGDFGNGIAVDPAGNVLTTGFFQGVADFDPGIGTANLTGAGSYDIFVSKLDAAGGYKWARSMGGSNPDQGYAIATDAAGNVYTTGYFSNTVDFDPGVGTANLSSAGGADIFVSKLDSAGHHVWARQMGGSDADYGYAIKADASGNVYTMGYYNSTADFDPGGGVANLTSAGVDDIFVSKLNGAGNYRWAKSLGGWGNDYGFGMTIDHSGSVYSTGLFNGTADFDPGPGTLNLNSDVGGHIYVQKMYCTDTSSGTVTATSCDSIVLNGIAYTASGTYTQVLTNAAGCDSTLRISLTIHHITPAVITAAGSVLSVAGTYTSYRWFWNNILISGATANTYTATRNGNYTVVVTDANGCTDTSQVYNVTGLGIGNRNEIAQQIRIYPNPAQEELHIQAPLPVQVCITSIEGKLILQEKNAETLSLRELSEGIYLIRISSKEGNLLKVEKLIKTK